MAATKNILGSVIGVTTSRKVAALTFDDGPDPEYTLRLLAILKRYNTRATFFMVGEQASRHRNVVKQVAEAGHAIGNHTWTHPSFPTIGRRERQRQLRLCSQAIAPYGTKLFRPPFGHQNVASRIDAFTRGYEVIAWSFHAYDWLNHEPNRMTQHILSRLQPGSIILLHDALYRTPDPRYANREATLETVEQLLGQTAGEYAFVTVPELLTYGPAKRRNWYKPADASWLETLQPRGAPEILSNAQIRVGK